MENPNVAGDIHTEEWYNPIDGGEYFSQWRKTALIAVTGLDM
jgi:hypothetical protein